MRYFTLLALLLGYLTSFGQLTVNVITTNASCGGFCDGTATAIPSGGTPPYTYLWNNGSIMPTVSGLCYGGYDVIVTDSTGQSYQEYILISDAPILMSLFAFSTDAGCTCAGSLTPDVIGGTLPYTYSWNTTPVQNTQTAINLCPGNYNVTITDANGCTTLATGQVTSSIAPVDCFSTINGKVYNDFNSNCNQDTLENGISNVLLVATPGPYYASTNINGNYTFAIPLGNYTITQVLPTNITEKCPISGSYSILLDSINNTVNNIDFADSIAPFQDVRVQLTSGVARPGFFYTYYLYYSSLNSVPMNGMVSLVFDSTILTYSTSSIAPDLVSGDTLFWNYSNLQMFENRLITATFYVPADVNLLGDTLSACAQITPLIGDVNVTDNTTCHERIIIGSYDPNDKQVFPQGDILLSDNELKYTIRFQNSGTDTAFTVVVVDTLSANLDVSSIKKVMASHPFDYSISGQGVLTFTFNNILLPDSNVNEPASHGLIEFTINQHPSNGIGTTIENTAEIYFDFNPAIVTNTVVNTIVLPTNIEEIKRPNTVSVYPNPTNGSLKVSFNTTNENELSIALFDITGRKVNEFIQNKTMNGSQVLDLNIREVKSGIYFLSVKIGDKNYTNKIVVR